MEITFSKYHGTGNDFILIDNRNDSIRLTVAQIARLCHRRFGIGADGLMLLETAADCDFRMVYYNADGNESTMCGNGGRCITAFARDLGLIREKTIFRAIDGLHHATINRDETISLEMIDVTAIEHATDYVLLDTGSPHYIQWVDDTAQVDVYQTGKAIRSLEMFAPKGINVNFVQRLQNGLRVRTYERGVEDETMSCGTGVTAAAIAATGPAIGTFRIPVSTPGGELEVSFEKTAADTAHKVILKGPAVFVFQGTIVMDAI